MADGFYRVPYGPEIYEVADGVAFLTTDEQWITAGSPPLDDAPVTYERYYWSPTLYATITWSPTSTTVTALSWSQWAAAGFPTAAVVPHVVTSTYLQILGEATIYQVSPILELHPLSFGEWVSAQTPPPSTIGALPGSKFHVWPTADTVYSVDVLGRTRAMSWEHWRLAGFPSPMRLTNQGIYKWPWDPNVLHYTDVAGGVGQALSWDEWHAMAFPNPRIVARLPGDSLTKYWGDATISYSAPGLATRGLSFVQWSTMGYPAPVVVNPPILVYGTLRTGESAHYLIGNDTYRESIGRAPLHELYDAGTFPYAVPNSENRTGIVAESMWVNDTVYATVVARLDRYERYDPALPIDRQTYMRVLRSFIDSAGESTTGYIYVATPRTAAYAVASLPWISSGDWLRR